MAGKPAVTTHGLKALRRDLRAMDKALPRELGKGMKGAAERTVLPRVRSDAPHRSGALAQSMKVSARAASVAIRSRLPYAGPVHWGWPAHNIEPQPFIPRAAEETGEAFVDALGDGFEDLAARHGFNHR